jgi:hypothetical protein
VTGEPHVPDGAFDAVQLRFELQVGVGSGVGQVPRVDPGLVVLVVVVVAAESEEVERGLDQALVQGLEPVQAVCLEVALVAVEDAELDGLDRRRAVLGRRRFLAWCGNG